MTMDDERLERAIAALPLEEPPEGLRASILLATAYRPAPAFSFFELSVAGSLGAVALWMVVLLVLGGGSLFVHTLAVIGSVVSHIFSNLAVLAWLAAGGATAVWLTLFTGFQPVAVASHRSSSSRTTRRSAASYNSSSSTNATKSKSRATDYRASKKH